MKLLPFVTFVYLFLVIGSPKALASVEDVREILIQTKTMLNDPMTVTYFDPRNNDKYDAHLVEYLSTQTRFELLRSIEWAEQVISETPVNPKLTYGVWTVINRCYRAWRNQAMNFEFMRLGVLGTMSSGVPTNAETVFGFTATQLKERVFQMSDDSEKLLRRFPAAVSLLNSEYYHRHKAVMDSWSGNGANWKYESVEILTASVTT